MKSILERIVSVMFNTKNAQETAVISEVIMKKSLNGIQLITRLAVIILFVYSLVYYTAPTILMALLVYCILEQDTRINLLEAELKDRETKLSRFEMK